MRLLAVAVALIVSLAACGGLRRAPPENTGLGAITGITMQKTPCYGTCPVYAVRFMLDGRARYFGGDNAPLQGHFSGTTDVAALAAWIATQQPETLPDTYPTANIDAPGVNLQIDYGARRLRFKGISESSASLRLEGILLALDGATSRIRWRRDDAATAFLGRFRGTVTLNIGQDSTGTFYAGSNPWGCPHHSYAAKMERGMLRLSCAGRTSVLRIAGDDVQAEGNAVPPGRYARVNPYAMTPENRWPRPSRPRD
jgi:hypothetical protein